ncbi:CsxC family protein [Halobacillus sp. K22]|uniref:CsxC family protein n=1 Tax=Halobacillus sp. K22 TaxID=3457431 RepID=UPI003FCDDF53
MSKKEHHYHDCVDLNTSASIEQCMNEDTDTPVTPAGTRLVRIPVNLGNFNVTTNMVANIEFPHPVLEIKDIKKRVVILQCRLMTRTSTGGDDQFAAGPFPLFIKGYVRKNIQYASPCFNKSGECVSSKLKSLTVKIPFECMTSVTLESPVQLPVTNTRSEFDFFRAQDLGKGYPEKDQFLSSDISQFHQTSTAAYNALPYCELLAHEIIEWDEATDRRSHHYDYDHSPVDEGYFHHVVEKMMVTFTVSVLQEQQVRITAG